MEHNCMDVIFIYTTMTNLFQTLSISLFLFTQFLVSLSLSPSIYIFLYLSFSNKNSIVSNWRNFMSFLIIGISNQWKIRPMINMAIVTMTYKNYELENFNPYELWHIITMTSRSLTLMNYDLRNHSFVVHRSLLN